MSADGVPIEEIARLAGHNQTATTELVYRDELRPVITTGAEVMDRILSRRKHQNSAGSSGAGRGHRARRRADPAGRACRVGGRPGRLRAAGCARHLVRAARRFRKFGLSFGISESWGEALTVQGSLHEVYGPLGRDQAVSLGPVGRERGVDGVRRHPFGQLRADGAVSLPCPFHLAVDEVTRDRGQDERVTAYQAVLPALGHHLRQPRDRGHFPVLGPWRAHLRGPPERQVRVSTLVHHPIMIRNHVLSCGDVAGDSRDQPPQPGQRGAFFSHLPPEPGGTGDGMVPW
jgi:hypothetical protein